MLAVAVVLPPLGDDATVIALLVCLAVDIQRDTAAVLIAIVRVVVVVDLCQEHGIFQPLVGRQVNLAVFLRGLAQVEHQLRRVAGPLLDRHPPDTGGTLIAVRAALHHQLVASGRRFGGGNIEGHFPIPVQVVRIILADAIVIVTGGAHQERVDPVGPLVQAAHGDGQVVPAGHAVGNGDSGGRVDEAFGGDGQAHRIAAVPVIIALVLRLGPEHEADGPAVGIIVADVLGMGAPALDNGLLLLIIPVFVAPIIALVQVVIFLAPEHADVHRLRRADPDLEILAAGEGLVVGGAVDVEAQLPAFRHAFAALHDERGASRRRAVGSVRVRPGVDLQPIGVAGLEALVFAVLFPARRDGECAVLAVGKLHFRNIDCPVARLAIVAAQRHIPQNHLVDRVLAALRHLVHAGSRKCALKALRAHDGRHRAGEFAHLAVGLADGEGHHVRMLHRIGLGFIIPVERARLNGVVPFGPIPIVGSLRVERPAIVVEIHEDLRRAGRVDGEVHGVAEFNTVRRFKIAAAVRAQHDGALALRQRRRERYGFAALAHRYVLPVFIVPPVRLREDIVRALFQVQRRQAQGVAAPGIRTDIIILQVAFFIVEHKRPVIDILAVHGGIDGHGDILAPRHAGLLQTDRGLRVFRQRHAAAQQREYRQQAEHFVQLDSHSLFLPNR